MGKLYDDLLQKIAYAKTCELPQNQLYYVHGMIDMANILDGLTTEEYLAFNHECVAKGINNPKFFDRWRG